MNNLQIYMNQQLNTLNEKQRIIHNNNNKKKEIREMH